MSASIRVFLFSAPFVKAQFYVYKFSRYTSRRGFYRSAQLSNCAGSDLLYIQHCHCGVNSFRVIRIKLFANFLNLVGLLVTCLILCQFLIFELIWALWTFPTKLMRTCLRYSCLAEFLGLWTLCRSHRDSWSPLSIPWKKRDSEKRRVIADLSWPCGHSVNDGIPSDSYLGEPLVLPYLTIDDIVDAVVTLGRGCHLYKGDLRKVYRQFPVDPKDYPFLGYTWDNHFSFDTVLTMGLRSASMACQRSTSAVAWIVSQQDHLVFNYLGDFIGVSPALTTHTDFQALSD